MSIVERALAKAGVAAGRNRTDGAGRAPRRIGSGTGGSTDALAGDVNGYVDMEPATLQAAHLVPPASMERRIAEELRLIKRPLLLNAENDAAPLPNGNLVMIASALPGAGKTFLSLNLALSMASELDWSVLLVDADVSRATLSRSLGLADAPGLVGLLEEEHGDLADFAFKTNYPGLHVLPAGPSRPHVKELLGSQRMRTLVADLTEGAQRRIVVLDSPPLLLTSEARVLASYAGQILLVVEAGVTPRRSVREAIEVLDPTKAINLVLNKNRQLVGVGDYYADYEPYGREAEQEAES
jgi:exopolysaccharide/PEP-CTERM locus tyrosine autokinase